MNMGHGCYTNYYTANSIGRGRMDGILTNTSGLYVVEERPPSGYVANPSQIPFWRAGGRAVHSEIL